MSSATAAANAADQDEADFILMPFERDRKLNIYQRIAEVMKEVAYIKKAKEVAGKYKAVTHDQVTALTRRYFIKHGVDITPREISSSTVQTGTVTKGSIPIIRFEAKYEVDFVNIDDPSDKATVSLTTHANDEGDKAPGKAISYAVKSAVLKKLQIETGESDESRLQVDDDGVITAHAAPDKSPIKPPAATKSAPSKPAEPKKVELATAGLLKMIRGMGEQKGLSDDELIAQAVEAGSPVVKTLEELTKTDAGALYTWVKQAEAVSA